MLIESYEYRNIPDTEGNPVDTLKVLIEEHLKQSDLADSKKITK